MTVEVESDILRNGRGVIITECSLARLILWPLSADSDRQEQGTRSRFDQHLA